MHINLSNSQNTEDPAIQGFWVVIMVVCATARNLGGSAVMTPSCLPPVFKPGSMGGMVKADIHKSYGDLSGALSPRRKVQSRDLYGGWGRGRPRQTSCHDFLPPVVLVTRIQPGLTLTYLREFSGKMVITMLNIARVKAHFVTRPCQSP